MIVAGTRTVMVIMATGKGKSLLFMLPAKVSKGGLTIVIVPFDLLRLVSRGGVMMQRLEVKSGTARGHHLVPG